MSNLQWSDLYLDYITHYPDSGSFGPNSFRRSTVCVVGSVFQLSKWYKGCGFNPETVNYSSMDDAKIAGEDWYHKGF